MAIAYVACVAAGALLSYCLAPKIAAPVALLGLLWTAFYVVKTGPLDNKRQRDAEAAEGRRRGGSTWAQRGAFLTLFLLGFSVPSLGEELREAHEVGAPAEQSGQ